MENPEHEEDSPLASNKQGSIATLKMKTPHFEDTTCYTNLILLSDCPVIMPCHSWADFNFRSDHWFMCWTVLSSAPVLALPILALCFAREQPYLMSLLLPLWNMSIKVSLALNTCHFFLHYHALLLSSYLGHQDPN